MPNLIKKIVAIATTITCAVWLLGPASVSAITAAELQAQINALLAQLQALQDQLATLEAAPAVTGCTITSFDRNLSQGMSGDDVKCLQITLNTASDTQVAASGVGSPGSETSFFGSLTRAAVVKFQEKYASEVLSPIGLTAGTGFVGSMTRTKLNSLLAVAPAEEEEEEVVTEEEEEEVVTTAATVALAADTPAQAQVAKNAQDVVFTKVKFTGGSAGYTISKIIVTRGGVSADADIASIKLYDGTTRIGSAQALNTTTHKATFSSLSWNVPAGETKTLTIKASVAATPTVGDSVKLGIVLAADITSTVSLEGTFPMYGNTLTIAGISVGGVDVDNQTTPAAATILSGATEQEIAAFKFTASSTEGVDIHSIKITHVGSATRDDVSNIKLKVSGVQIGSTVAKMDSSNAATFDLSAAPLTLLASGSKTVYAYADIASGIWTTRTVIFEITQYTDVTAYGANSGGAMTVTYGSGTSGATAFSTFIKQTGQTMTIGQGTLTITIDASLNPASQSYVKGTTSRLISAFKFSTGSREGVRMTQLKLKLNNGSGSATDISNITLWDGSTQIAGPASLIGSYVTFGANTVGWDETGIFDVAKSTNKTIQVKADIPSGATSGNTVDLDVDAAGDVYADGLDSKYDIPSSSITLSSGSGNTHTVKAYGGVSVSLSANTPPAQTYVKGATEKEFARINLTADSGEDFTVSSFSFGIKRGGAENAASGDVTNVKLYKSDGTQFGSTVAAPTATAAFSGSMTLAASQTATVKIVADIPSTSNATSGGLYFTLASSSDAITSTGVSSSREITESGLVVSGNTLAVGQGSLTVSAAVIPGDQNIIKGATDVSFVGLVFTAGTAENIRITSVKLYTSTQTWLTGQVSTTDVSNIALYDGATRLTTKKQLTDSAANAAGLPGTRHNLTWSSSDFLNSTGIEVAKGQQKTITVKADLPSTATANHTIALGIASSTDSSSAATATTGDVIFTGLDSNTSPDTLVTIGTNLAGANYSVAGNAGAAYVTVQNAGTLTAIIAPDTPVKAMVAIGETGASATFAKYTFKAEREAIDITSVSVARLNASDNAIASISLWDGTTQLGGTQSLVNSTSTFNFPASSYWRLPAGTEKTLTVKASLNGIKTADVAGVTTGDAPKLCIRVNNEGNLALGTLGVSSGVTTIRASTTDSAIYLCGNEQILVKSKPTLAAATLPSNSLAVGQTNVLYRWTVTADAKGAIGWSRVIFDVSGTLHKMDIGTTANTYTIGQGGATSSDSVDYTNTSTDGVYMGTTTNPSDAVKLIATSSLKVYNTANNEEVTASNTSAWVNVWNFTNGGARIVFYPGSEQVIAAGETKTYELRGDLLAGAGITVGDNIVTKIEVRSTATTTASSTVVANNGTNLDVADGGNSHVTSTAVTFVWTDRSGAGGTHTSLSNDWLNDYKVSGLATGSLSLTK